MLDLFLNPAMDERYAPQIDKSFCSTFCLLVTSHALNSLPIRISFLADTGPCDWQELLEHPFWHFSLTERKMPEEPAFEAFVAAHNLRPALPDPQSNSFDKVGPDFTCRNCEWTWCVHVRMYVHEVP